MSTGSAIDAIVHWTHTTQILPRLIDVASDVRARWSHKFEQHLVFHTCGVNATCDQYLRHGGGLNASCSTPAMWQQTYPHITSISHFRGPHTHNLTPNAYRWCISATRHISCGLRVIGRA